LELGAAPVELLNLRTTWDPDAEAYATSGPVSINLAAGKTYFIGLEDDSGFQYKAAAELRNTQDVTFGRAIGAIETYLPITAPTTPGYLVTQRLTTDAP
jgi:hypothetical protein